MKPIAWREGRYPCLLMFSGYLYAACRIGSMAFYVEWKRGIGLDLGVEE